MNVPEFTRAKRSGRRLTVLTAYDCLWAALLDEAGIDALLVGDSLGMVFQGEATTMPVTVEQMIYHGRIVARAAKQALVIVDLPFMSYQVSPRQAVRNAGRILKETGCHAVKLEGGANQEATIRRLADCDLPVMAHVGMRPQSVRKLGKMSTVQRDEERLVADAVAAEQAGAFAVVLELIPRAIAKRITETVSIPTIGIGAGPDCDGQVLVTPDMFGMTGFKPRFVKQYADLRTTIVDAARSYISEVGAKEFPTDAHSH